MNLDPSNNVLKRLCIYFFSLKLCRPAGDSATLTSLGSSKTRQAVYEVCLHVVHGRLKQDQALNALVDLQVIADSRIIP